MESTIDVSGVCKYKTKITGMSSTSLKRKLKKEKENLSGSKNNIQKQNTKNIHMKITNLKKSNRLDNIRLN